ncbi:MAG: xylan 1,4-beta-xylosidase [Ignavibacteria bacterium GWA2_35_9]|nr:MAG: xylan 1,4-beta-xylosidase [Ignavibacteria bacterium GWA2_35_9]OGU52981.1 MAG: xylan 1,4-beta-xylosidase [Ignavibacteria bacterium GWC2_36_12]
MNKLSALLLFVLLSVSTSDVFTQDRLFTNPILAGFYPDPSICRVGNNYYMINSTFSYFPGIPVFHSKDLVNWKLIGHVMDRPEQMDLTGLGVSRGIFAPAIRFNKGIFYVTCTLVDAGGNFIVTSASPEGPWSNPVWIPKINGIDPSMFFDDNGKAYIIYNSVAPDNKPLYDGHRTIRMYEFDVENLKVVGEEKVLVNGGVDLSKKPVWIEGPHIFKVNDYYYLIAAEGGTGDQHSEVVFRSDNVDGPYVPYEKNPILTQRHLDPDRKNPITSTGHADLIQTENGDWLAVFLGCRPYSMSGDGFYNTGRETFLAPVKWIDGWPIINPDYEEVQYEYSYPLESEKDLAERPYSGNFEMQDEFDEDQLNINWMFLRTPHEKWYSLEERKGFLSLQLIPETCSEKMNPAFLGHRQQHLNCSATTAIDFKPESENEKAGLLIFQNEEHFYFICKSLENNKEVIQLYKSGAADEEMELITSREISNEQNENLLYLEIKAEGNKYSFFYSKNKHELDLLKEDVDAMFLSTRVAGGFVGCMFAFYATSLGKESNNKAYFDFFNYEGNDEVYKK